MARFSDRLCFWGILIPLTSVHRPRTLPDGSAAPVIAVFDTNRVTLTGTVPTQAAKDLAGALAASISKVPVPVVEDITVDPSVPANIGVRVVELTSARFDPSSAVVGGFHQLGLDRIGKILVAFW